MTKVNKTKKKRKKYEKHLHGIYKSRNFAPEIKNNPKKRTRQPDKTAANIMIKNIFGSVTPAQLQALESYCNSKGHEITGIFDTWTICRFKYSVKIKTNGLDIQLSKVLDSIFGTAEYFWNDAYLICAK